MFTTLSKAGIGMYVFVAITILQSIGIDLDEGTATEAVLAIIGGISAALWLLGQLLRKDLSWGMLRKK